MMSEKKEQVDMEGVLGSWILPDSSLPDCLPVHLSWVPCFSSKGLSNLLRTPRFFYVIESIINLPGPAPGCLTEIQ